MEPPIPSCRPPPAIGLPPWAWASPAGATTGTSLPCGTVLLLRSSCGVAFTAARVGRAEEAGTVGGQVLRDGRDDLARAHQQRAGVAGRALSQLAPLPQPAVHEREVAAAVVGLQERDASWSAVPQ